MKRLLAIVLPVLLCILFVACSIFFTNDIHSNKRANGDDSSETIAPSTDQFADGGNRKPADLGQNKPVAVPSNKSTFTVRFIDVGQADAALIECDGHYMLIDGGNKSDSSLIYTVLKNSSVSYLGKL